MSEESEEKVEIYNQQDPDYEDIILRRSDPDDLDQVLNLIQYDDIYNRFYSYPKIMRLIETSYLSISVLNQEGQIIAFATFEDYPQGRKSTYDDLHYNYWEDWFEKAFNVREFNSSNTLWMTFFSTMDSISEEDQGKIFKKVLQTVYTSLPDILGILFLMKGDAEEDDIKKCFEPLGEYFEEIR